MKTWILCIFLTIVGLSHVEAKANNYILYPQNEYYIIQQPLQRMQSVIMVTETQYYHISIPVQYPIYVQQYNYWQYPYRKVCYRLFRY